MKTKIDAEVWKKVVGYENLYEVSDQGRVRSITRQIVLSPSKSGRYDSVNLSLKRKQATFTVHRLVATAFIHNPMSKPQVNHIDNDPKNNKAENLEWVTISENLLHSYATNGRQSPAKPGEGNGRSKITEADARFIKQNFIPKHPIYGGCALGRRFGISGSQATLIARGQKGGWTHLDEQKTKEEVSPC